MPPTIALLFALPALALDPPAAGAPGPAVLVARGYLDPAFPLSPDLSKALANRDHAAALPLLAGLDRASLHGHQLDDLAFLQAWELLRSSDEAARKKAIPLLDAVRQSDHAPADYRHLVVGEILLASDQWVAAAEELAQVGEDTPVAVRARISLATAHDKSGATAESQAMYQALAARPDPSEGTELALWALARKAGLDSPQAYPYLRRLWAWYPRSEQGLDASKRMAGFEARGARYKATDDEVAAHGEALMNAWAHKMATDYLGEQVGRFTQASPAACRAWYALGRSHFKRNNVTMAAKVLVPAGRKCAGIDDDLGAKALYVAGKALERKKEWADAARAYELIPQLYPEHSMADDGYVLGGIGWQESGDVPRAMKLWTALVDSNSGGDLAAEGYWRLAWNTYQGGDTAKAIEWAERLVWEVPIEYDPVHYLAARYWAARWRIYPDLASPDLQNPDPEQVAAGVDGLLALCKEHPTRFYSLLAASRLSELAPARLAAIDRPPPVGAPDTWTVRAAFLAEPRVARAMELTRLGLVAEALAEIAPIGDERVTPSEMAMFVEILNRKDWLGAHDRMHHYLLQHPPSTLGPDRDRILRDAYPDTWWDLVQAAADGYGYDPRVFHALVREESSFNKDIVSFAGARGLSQLMPATARTVAEWMKIPSPDLSDPATNLKIGARYLEYLQDTYDGDMFLAVAAYNAGPGNVGSWLKARGDRPVDEWIETIPFRETRAYVKRVLGTYQLYRCVYDPGPLFPDWSAYVHRAKPAG